MTAPAGSTLRYVTATQVREVLAPEGLDDAGSTAAAMEDDPIETAITEAADEVDGKLGGRYGVPFADPVPSLVVSVTRDIAAYLASLTFRRGDPLPPGDPVGLRYARAEQLLGSLASGTAELPASTGVTAEAGQVAVVNPYDGDLFSLDDFGLQQGPGVPGPALFPSGSEWR